MDASGRRSTASNARSRHDSPRGRTKDKTHSVSGSLAKGEMTIPRPQEWTEAEVHRLRMLAKRKVSADNIAKSLGRYVGSVKIKAVELRLILSKKAKK